MKKIKIILNLKKIKKISEICLVFLIIFAWLFSGWQAPKVFWRRGKVSVN